MEHTPSFKSLSDVDLTDAVVRLAKQERSSTAELLAGLEEFDRRRLYLGLGFTSIYAYCREELHLTDGAAYRRIEVARASRRFPILLDMLRDGRLSLATACLLMPKLEAGKTDGLLALVVYKSKREVEAILAARHPQRPVPAVVRKLPEPKPLVIVSPQEQPTAKADAEPESVAARAAAPTAQPASRRAVVAPLSEAHYKLQVTISTAARERLREIQDLMRHTLPNGDPAAIIERALEVLHAELLKKKAAQVARPRAGRPGADTDGRQIPASVKREVWLRDEGRCAFVGDGGKRCGEGGALEYHHVQPFAVGGRATVANIGLRCRAHNGFEWERHLDEQTLAMAGR